MRNFVALIMICFGFYSFYLDKMFLGIGLLVAGWFFADATNNFDSSERHSPDRYDDADCD